MPSQIQLSGGAFQSAIGSPLANGYLLLSLSQDAQVSSQEIGAGSEIKILLDSSGNVASSPAQSVWPNDVLSPANTFYNVSAYTAEGQRVWGPNAQQVLSSPSPYDIGAWIPGAVNVLNPGGNITGLIEAGENVTIMGSGTGSSPYTIASTGGGGGGGVTEFNTRTGAVTLESSDVTTALGFTPANSATTLTALTGDVTASGPGSAVATLASVNANPGTVGSTSAVPVITSDAKGRITAVSTAALGTMATQNAGSISITGGSITNTPIGSASTGQSSGGFSSLVVGDQLTSACIVGNSTLLEGENSAGAPMWTLTNQTGAAKFASLEVGSSQSITGVQGSTGTSLAAANGTFTSGNLVTSDANGNLTDSGIAKPSAAFGTMATENASSVAITGGTINGTTIGATTPEPGSFTTLNSSGAAVLKGLLSGGTNYSTYKPTLNLSSTAASSFPAIDEVFPSGGIFRTGEVSVVGTNDVFFQAIPATSAGYGVLEAYAAAGLALETGTSTPILFRPNRTEGMRMTSAGALCVGTTTPASGSLVTVAGTLTATELATTQTPTASTTASDHSIPIVVNGTTYYMRLSSTP